MIRPEDAFTGAPIAARYVPLSRDGESPVAG